MELPPHPLVVQQPFWPRRDASHLLVSSSGMAALEQELFDSGLPVEALMEKAALAMAQRLQQKDWWPQLQRRGALVLVGPGHNGGDGLVVARELHLAGIAVQTWSPFERRKPLTETHRRHARWLGIQERNSPPEPGDAAVWIDALFGIGQNRAPEAALQSLLAAREKAQPGLLIALDGPTGLCADRGEPLGQSAASAALTLSIGLIKQGFLQDHALRWVGTVERIDLGLPQTMLNRLPVDQPLALQRKDLASAPWPRTDDAASKYQRGRLLVIAGSNTYRGAAQLCLAGASASGCGSVRAALPSQVCHTLWQAHPHVVVSAALDTLSRGELSLSGLSATALERLDAVVVGPGIGAIQQEETAAEAASWERLQQLEAVLVIDADGLRRVQQMGGRSWLQQRRGPTWLTPHPGEFARLFPDWAMLPPLSSAALAAEACSGQQPCSVVLKGARSVVAAADGRRWQISQASPNAARAGLGDVLAGYAAGLAARSQHGDASVLATAALAHACAGLDASASQGPGGASPSAVAMQLQMQENTTQTPNPTI
jgi:NAD(P)H-hydrate epimerase